MNQDMNNYPMSLDEERAYFETLYNQHWDMACRVVFRHLGNAADVNDIVHDVFSKLWEKRAHRIADNFGGYLYSAIKNKCISILRRRTTWRIISEKLKHTQENVKPYNGEKIKEKVEIDELIEKLSMYERFILILKIIENYTYEEIAIILGKSRNTIRKDFENTLDKLYQQYYEVQEK